ncbi:hypothetical protein [Actinomadura napierensis]|uniref:Uncharacterized protein n=1 Tax=Actinomadura napierensis TaxID=267854 RepID=A0ABN3ACI5_9ACTN
MDLGESFRRAQGALADIYGTEHDTKALQQAATQEQTPTDEHTKPSPAEIQSAAKDFPHRIGDVLSGTRTSPPPSEYRPSPKPPPPRREM